LARTFPESSQLEEQNAKFGVVSGRLQGLLIYPAAPRHRELGSKDQRLRRLAGTVPLRALALFPAGFVAVWSKVSTYSRTAPCLLEKWLSARRTRINQQTLEA